MHPNEAVHYKTWQVISQKWKHKEDFQNKKLFHISSKLLNILKAKIEAYHDNKIYIGLDTTPRCQTKLKCYYIYQKKVYLQKYIYKHVESFFRFNTLRKKYQHFFYSNGYYQKELPKNKW